MGMHTDNVYGALVTLIDWTGNGDGMSTADHSGAAPQTGYIFFSPRPRFHTASPATVACDWSNNNVYVKGPRRIRRREKVLGVIADKGSDVSTQPRTVKRGQRIKPGRTFFQLILPLNQPLKTNYLVSFSVLS